MIKDTDYVIALSPYWQGSSYPPPYCGRKISITNTGGGQSNNGVGKVVIATVEDTCLGCNENHLGKEEEILAGQSQNNHGHMTIDLSHGAFQALTGGNLDPPGQFNIDW